ncbi:MAG TPA: hypothetical protein VLA04_04155 [Verrucomicrobiae bacterium]|nr:hypothetical protein [Verrucomicrobiae bacterium]
MNLLIIYFLLVFILMVFSALVITNFWRYRFKGDKTALLMSLFVVAFILVMSTTLFLVTPGALSSGTQRNNNTGIIDPFS